MTNDFEMIWKDRFIKRTYEKAGFLAERYNVLNYRLHPEQQQAITEGSLDRLGFIGEVKISSVSEKMFDGHLRVKIALIRGGPDTLLPVNWYDLDEEETKQALLIHDSTTGMATIDFNILDDLIKNTPSLEIPEFDDWLKGVLDEGADQILEGKGKGGNAPEPKVDKAAELQGVYGTKLGQIWELGQHRIAVGDCTDKAVVEGCLQNDSLILMVTDPPYGVEYDPEWREEYDQYERHSTDRVTNDDNNDWSQAYRLFTGDVGYVWHSGFYVADVALQLREVGFCEKAHINWVKQHFVFGRGHYHWQHESCWYVVRKGKTSNWQGLTNETTVWEIQNKNPMGGKKDDSNTNHGTQKPIECMARPIRNNSKVNEFVYDPFVGSGTTLIACEQLKRKCRAVEIEPKYVAVALQRFYDYSGILPKLISDS